MHKASSADFVELAGPSLQSLAVDFQEVADDERDWVLYSIVSCSGLTRLELSNLLGFRRGRAEELDRLPLQELVFINCSGAPGDVIVPGALPALQRLHIEDDLLSWWKSNRRGDRNNVGMWELRRSLAISFKFMLGLPKLRQLSGVSSFFEVGMKKKLKGWEVSEYEAGMMTSNNDFWDASMPSMPARKVWIRQ